MAVRPPPLRTRLMVYSRTSRSTGSSTRLSIHPVEDVRDAQVTVPHRHQVTVPYRHHITGYITAYGITNLYGSIVYLPVYVGSRRGTTSRNATLFDDDELVVMIITLIISANL